MINYSKQIFSANALPKSMDETYGFFSRIILMDFPNRFEKRLLTSISWISSPPLRSCQASLI